jgi:hypothetical protein
VNKHHLNAPLSASIAAYVSDPSHTMDARLKVPSMIVDLMLPAAEKITIVLEAIGDDKIRVNSSSFDYPLTILPDQAIENPHRALHTRIAETLERQFEEIAENQPEVLARHCVEAGLIEKAAGFWGKAGQRSLERSAVLEAVEQLTRALAQIATQPGTPALRREQIKFQVGLMNALMQTKGHAAPETRAAAERARLLIENAGALGEPPEDPLLLFSVLWGFWVANYAAFKGDVVHELASELLELAEKQGANVPS